MDTNCWRLNGKGFINGHYCVRFWPISLKGPKANRFAGAGKLINAIGYLFLLFFFLFHPDRVAFIRFISLVRILKQLSTAVVRRNRNPILFSAPVFRDRHFLAPSTIFRSSSSCSCSFLFWLLFFTVPFVSFCVYLCLVVLVHIDRGSILLFTPRLSAPFFDIRLPACRFIVSISTFHLNV